MLIDWFTVLAQVINFLVLVWLMKHFLYKPVMGAIETREKKIAAQLADASQKKAEAQKESDDFKHKNEVLDQERGALLAKANGEAQAERERLISEAKKNLAALSLKQSETLKEDENNLLQTMAQRTQQEVFAIARKALADLAGTSLEERMVDIFIRRLHDLGVDVRKSLLLALNAMPGPLVVRTAFDLPLALQTSTANALKENLGTQMQVHFETAPALISGIEFNAGGNKVAWSLADYITSLEKSVVDLGKEAHGN